MIHPDLKIFKVIGIVCDFMNACMCVYNRYTEPACVLAIFVCTMCMLVCVYVYEYVYVYDVYEYAFIFKYMFFIIHPVIPPTR